MARQSRLGLSVVVYVRFLLSVKTYGKGRMWKRGKNFGGDYDADSNAVHVVRRVQSHSGRFSSSYHHDESFYDLKA